MSKYFASPETTTQVRENHHVDTHEKGGEKITSGRPEVPAGEKTVNDRKTDGDLEQKTEDGTVQTKDSPQEKECAGTIHIISPTYYELKRQQPRFEPVHCFHMNNCEILLLCPGFRTK
jgi:hypothetical protein